MRTCGQLLPLRDYSALMSYTGLPAYVWISVRSTKKDSSYTVYYIYDVFRTNKHKCHLLIPRERQPLSHRTVPFVSNETVTFEKIIAVLWLGKNSTWHGKERWNTLLIFVKFPAVVFSSALTRHASRTSWRTCRELLSTATSWTSAARSRLRCRIWEESSSSQGWVHLTVTVSLTQETRNVFISFTFVVCSVCFVLSDKTYLNCRECSWCLSNSTEFQTSLHWRFK